MSDFEKDISILLIDDEADIRDVLEISLSDIGYTVVTAANGNDALSLFRENPFPIVITDIKMPGLDGIELLRHIKGIYPDTQVIMITGHGDTELAIKSLKYEATDFITKPINDDALFIALNRAKEKIITERQLRDYTRRLENLLREKSELQDHLSSLGMMIGSISHGLKGLLTRLDAGVYLITSALPEKNDTDITDGLSIIKHSVDRIKKMVLDILYYAKERELNIEASDIRSFADEILKSVTPKIERHNIELIHECALPQTMFEVDTESLHSAIVNILDNAVDACISDPSPKNHRIVFSIKPAPNDAVIFEIKDDGIGMNSGQKEKIFTLFYSSKGKKGTGFGLFIADNIIKQHNGSILVTSAPGKGTRFTVRLPLKHVTTKGDS